jgi:hypothetical protein
MTKRILAVAACLAAACGGGGGDHANPATTRSFTYAAGAPAPAPAGTAAALATVLAFQSAPSSTGAQLAPGALLDAADAAIGDPGLAFKGQAKQAAPILEKVRAAALSAPIGPDPAFANCTIEASTGVRFADCRYEETTPDGVTARVTLNGSVNAAPGRVDWVLAMVVDMAQPGVMALRVTLDDEGDFAITPTTVDAAEAAELHVSATNGLETVALGLAQAATLDVGYEPTCATRITSGTFEGKRVWMERPRQATGLDLTDRAAKFTWAGCGSGTLQYSIQ